MALLSEIEIDQHLASLPEWRHESGDIVREFTCGDFVGSVAFVDALVAPAESMGHHPDVSISWDKVVVRISTHSEGGITEADFKLAAAIDRLH